MKTKIKRHSRSVISVILTVCMLVSCMTVGLIATDAANVTNSNSIGAKDDSEAVGAIASRIYFKPGANWTDASAKFGANFNENGSNYSYQIMTQVSGDTDYYYVDVPSGKTHVEFTRLNSTATSATSENTWNWGTNVEIPSGKNCFVRSTANNGWDTSGTWTVYIPQDTPVFSLVGNISSDYIVNSSIAESSLSTDTLKWGTHYSAFDVNTGSNGVYSITFTTVSRATLDTNNHNLIDIGFFVDGIGQYGTRLGNQNFNTNGADLPVPSYGIEDNLYAIAGTGSIVLQPSTTYTITIDQTTRPNSGDVAKITIATTPSYELHIGTNSNNWGQDLDGVMSQVGATSVYERTKSLSAGTYYYYVTTTGASSNAGWYYKTNQSTDTQSATLGSAMSLGEYYARTGNNDYGGAKRLLSYTVSSAGDYKFTFDYTTTGSPTLKIESVSASSSYYCLTGNVTDKYIVGSTLVKPSGIDENYWWSHYWDETAINNKVDDGVFSTTFTTTDYDGTINVGFAGKNNVQYAFIKDGTAYNTWGNDLPVTGDITDSDNLYVYTKDTGGSLALQPNTTYTITVDQTQQQASGQPYGKITIDATTVYANAINMVRPFDVTNRRPSDLEQSNAGGTLTVTSSGSSASTSGTATVATVTHAKPMTATYTASSANSGYTFAGWYSDEDCTTKVSDNLSYTPDEFSVTKTLYALYTEDEPSTSYDVTVTKSGTGDGTISVTGAAVSSESGNTVTYSAYAGATVTVTAAPSTSPLSVLASITGSGATVSGNTATIENIAENKALTVTFNEKTTYTVTLKGTNGQIKAQAYQSDKTTTSGSEVTVASGSTGTIEVPIGGYLKLTAGDADSGKEFSNFKLETGKYKRTSDQSTGTSPMTIRPTDDMTAEAVFGNAGESSTWNLRLTTGYQNNDKPLKKYTGLKVTGFNDDLTKDVYMAQVTTTGDPDYFIFYVDSTELKFTSSGAISLSNTEYANDPNQNYGNATNNKTISAGTYYVYAMVEKQDSGKVPKEIKVRFSTTKLHGSSSTIDTTGYQRIYAMDGTLGSTAGYGDTVITIGNGLLENDIEDASGNSELYVDAHTNHNVYYFDPNQNISFRVQTTVDSAQTKLGVRGFVYNGKSVDAIDDGDGVYYADITVKANSVLDINGGTTNNPILEVIPVYYNTTVPANEFITFYVDANTMDNKFGYNIGYYIWYTTSQHEVDGNYPGQPLLRSGTKYVGYIPKHYVSNTGTYSVSTTAFSGVLLDNLHENSSVHDECLESWGCDKINYQTFDYEDPYVISQIQDVDTIEFVAKFEETNSNHQTGTHWYNSTYNKAELKGKTSGYAFPSDISAPNSASQLNGFELLRNFDNKPVDVYGNELSTVNFADSVFIISVGNQDNGSANDWDTVWMIYQGGTGDHTLIKGDIPSSFINVAANLQLDTLKNKPAYISYEKFLDGSENAQTHSDGGKTGNSGDRIDGRWLYTKSTDATNGRIRVATLGKNNDTLSFLTYDEGASGARIAYYDNSVDGITQNGNSTKEDSYGRITTFANRTTTAKAVLNEPIGYKIKGFYMLKTGVSGSDNGFSYSISDYDEMVRESATVAKYTNARDTWIVAVVEPVPASNLYLKHEMYGGPGAHSGAGDFYIKADVVNANGTVVATSGDFVDGNDGYEFEHLNSVVQKGQGYKVKVTLRTVMAGTNTFYSWFTSDLATGDYDKEITTNSAGNNARGQNTPQETVIEVSVDDLFGSKTDGSFEYTNLAYYSDIDMGGAVYITHSLKDGSVGSGTTYASVRVLNGGNEVATFNTDYSATGTITVPSQYTKRTSGNTIEITLRTVPDEYSTFNKFWESDGTTEITGASVDSTTRIATKTLPTIAVSSLYKNTGTDQNPKYEFDTTKSSYQYYSDLTKSEYRYVIEYQYNSRIWGTQSYKVPAASHDEAFTVDEFNKYIKEAQVTDYTTTSTVSGITFKTDALKKEFLASKAPYEDNFRETITWDFTGATVSYYDSGKQLSIKVTTSSKDDDPLNLVVHFPFECTVQTTGLDVTRDSENKVQYVEGKTNFTARPLYMHRYTVNNKYDLTSEIYLQAPESVWTNGEEKFFSYWSLKDQKTGREYAKCYSRNLNYAFYQDTVVDLAYDNTSAHSPSDNADKGTSARIEFLENTRNQWNSNPGTSSWNPADRVISDFVLYYNYQGKQINTIQNMKAGLVFETVGNLDKDEHDNYITSRFTYASNHANDNLTTLKENVISFIGENKSSNETYLKSEFNTYRDTTRSAETINKNNGLDNKNEIEYYYTMAANGTKERELKYYRVYSYLKDANGNVVTVSDPIYLTIYDIASIQNGSVRMPGA